MIEPKYTLKLLNEKTVLRIFEDKVQYQTEGFLGAADIYNQSTGQRIKDQKELELYYCDILGYEFKNCGWTAGFFSFIYFDRLVNMKVKAKIQMGRATIGNAKKLALEAEPIHMYMSSVLNEFSQARSSNINMTTQKTVDSQVFSVADELSKLNNLLQLGAISQDEYDSLKAKIISR
jgi:hypothetical protein